MPVPRVLPHSLPEDEDERVAHLTALASAESELERRAAQLPARIQQAARAAREAADAADAAEVQRQQQLQADAKRAETRGRDRKRTKLVRAYLGQRSGDSSTDSDDREELRRDRGALAAPGELPPPGPLTLFESRALLFPDSSDEEARR
eukprot:TRINITY_DN36140_c0_g1_i1.p3 TRINITY_DN36140_c0_g1~~TRINITY_DN36140_c0_g1_i1.p3  ORF type:complete len:173 (+),score=77.15 TRINITY_DN36140_c0_g1_i1:74-520(+)